MLEITVTELALFTWAIVSTGMWFKHRESHRNAKLFLRALLEDDQLRAEVVADYNRVSKGA